MILTKEKIDSIDINKILNDKINNSKLEEILIIVPTNRKLRSLKKDLVLKSPNSTTGKINIETLVTLSSKLILGETYRNRLASEAVVSVLLSQSFKNVKLQYFNNYGGNIPSGTIDKIYNVISEYKKNGMTPENLFSSLEKLSDEVEKRKGNDITKIYKEYQKLLKEVNLFETGDIYSSAAKQNKTDFEKSFKELFPFVDTILISGFDEFYIPEIDIINSLSLINNSKLFLSFDYGNNEFLFNHLKTCYGQITAKGFNLIEDKTNYENSDFLLILKNNLFNPESERINKYKNRINIIKATDRRHEVTIIAKEIKKLISDDNIKPDSVAVVCNLIDNYSPLVKDVFNEFGLPLNLTDRTPLSNSSPVISIINLLEIIENDFYYKSLFRALSSGYCSVLKIDVSNLYKISSELGIISDYNKWIKDIDATISFISNYENSNNEKRIKHFQKARTDLNSIYNTLKVFNENLTPSDFNKELNNLINKMQIPIHLVNNKSDKKEENIKALTDFISLSSELTELYEDEFGKETNFDLHFYLNNLRTAVKSARFNIKERQGYGILVTTLNEIRGLKYQYLFIIGMNDGDLPTRYSPEIFFSPEYLEKYKIKHQYGERFLFYQALSSFEKSVYLTIPKTDGKKELMTSHFLNDLLKQFEVNEISSSVYDNLIYSVNNLLGNYSSIKDKIETLPFSKEFIGNAVNIEEARKTGSVYAGDYNGILNIENISDNNLLEEFKNKTFSITQLELYAACPYKYFLERILNIETVGEPDENIEAKEIGLLLHNILYKFYIKIKSEELILAGCDEKVFAKAFRIIIKIAKEEIEKLNFDKEVNFYEYEKILGVNGDSKNSILYLFLKTEQSLNPDFVPQLFEFSFGNENPLLIDNIKLRGKIDRVDIDDKNNFFKVYDYKLGGKKPSEYDLSTGLKLQLPLYLLALMDEKGNKYKPAEAAIYSLKFKEDEFGLSPLKPKGSRKTFETAKEEFTDINNSLIENAKRKIKEFTEGIVKGDFRLSPHENREEIVCRFCEFKSVCRVSNLDSYLLIILLLTN